MAADPNSKTAQNALTDQSKGRRLVTAGSHARKTLRNRSERDQSAAIKRHRRPPDITAPIWMNCFVSGIRVSAGL